MNAGPRTYAPDAAALERLRKQKRPPKWLVQELEGILARCEKVAPEMARHRDEIEVKYLERPG